MKTIVPAFICFLLLFSLSAVADTSSTHYKLHSEIPTGGGAYSISSSSYKVEESSLEWFTKEALTSTNYKVQGKIGIQGTENLVRIDSITPGDFARFFTDSSASYTLTATSPDASALEYQAKQDGTLKDGPKATSTLTWPFSTPDKGRHKASLQVLHPKGNVAQEQALYAYRRPVK